MKLKFSYLRHVEVNVSFYYQFTNINSEIVV